MFGFWRKVPVWARIVMAMIAVPIQGWFVYWIMAPHGPFLGQAGLACTLVPLLVEGVTAILTVHHGIKGHIERESNPFHPFHGLNKKRAPTPPPTTEAWDGKWSEPDTAAALMSKGRSGVKTAESISATPPPKP